MSARKKASRLLAKAARERERDARRSKQLFAASLRACPSKPEARLRDEICRAYPEYVFHSNPVVLGFIPDLFSEVLKLVIEVNGRIHESRKDYDHRRDAAFAAAGIMTVRIAAEQIFAGCQICGAPGRVTPTAQFSTETSLSHRFSTGLSTECS